MAKELYVNKKEADKCINDIIKQLNNISESLYNIENLLTSDDNKDNLEKAQINSIDLSKRCSIQRTTADKGIYNIKIGYSDDLKDYTIGLLEERINELESKISELI